MPLGSAIMKLLLEYVKQKTLHSFVAWGFQTFVEKQAKAFGDGYANKVQLDSKDIVLTRPLSQCFISDHLLETKGTFYSEEITGLHLPSGSWELCRKGEMFSQNVGIWLPSGKPFFIFFSKSLGMRVICTHRSISCSSMAAVCPLMAGFCHTWDPRPVPSEHFCLGVMKNPGSTLILACDFCGLAAVQTLLGKV